jgi:hypothetical protein
MAAHQPTFAFKGKVEEDKVANVDTLSETCDHQVMRLHFASDRNSLTNQFAPILSLPNELLSAIFQQGHLHSQKSPPIEIVMSHLNRRFRAVAMYTRLLWAKIEIFSSTPFDKVHAYLHRSGRTAFDLSFNIDTKHCCPRYSLDPTSAALLFTDAEWGTIMSHMTRCRRFSARFDSDSCIILHDMVDRLREVNAPLLRSFQIESLYWVDEQYLEPHRKILNGGAPSLTTVKVKGWGLHYCLPPLTIVTSLTLLPASLLTTWADLRDILSGNLALTCLVIGDIFVQYLPDGFESAIILPSLKFLRIFVNDRGGAPYVDDVLLAISSAVLECIFIDNAIEVDLTNIPEAYPQLAMSGRFPCLQHIIISLFGGLDVSQEGWTTLFTVFPSITRFSLRSNDEAVQSESLIALLGHHTADSISPMVLILPNLHTLTFGKISKDAVPSLCDLVSTREAAGRPLRLLHLPAYILHDEALGDSLSRLRERVEVQEYQADEIEVDGAQSWDGGQ